MSRLLLIGGLLLSLLVPGTAIAVIALSSSSPEQQTIDLPTAPSSGTGQVTEPQAVQDTESVKLFTGEEINVSGACTDSHHVAETKAAALEIANRLPTLKQSLLNNRRDLRRFLRRHPEQYLSQGDYATYNLLRARYRASVRTFNRQIDAFNRLADRYNADLLACKR